MSIKPIDDLRHANGSIDLARGSELLVHSITAAAPVLSGAAIQLSAR